MALAAAVGLPGGPPTCRRSAQRSRGGLQLQVSCKKRDKDHHEHHPYKVVEVTPPPTDLGVRRFPSSQKKSGGTLREPPEPYLATHAATQIVHIEQNENMHCGESVTIEGQAYTVSAVTHRYQLRKGRYEPREKRLDVQSTGRYILNLYLEDLLQKS